MFLTITTSGGLGGFGLAKSANILIEDLPETLRLETCARLDAASLAALPAGIHPGAADFVTYHFALAESGAATRKFDIPESALPGETLDLIDSLFALGVAK